MLTKVICMGSHVEKYYTLCPRDSLVAAYEQSKGNFNTWTYKDTSEYPIQAGGHFLYLHGFAVAITDQLS